MVRRGLPLVSLGKKYVDLLIVSHFAEQVTLGLLLRYQGLLRYA